MSDQQQPKALRLAKGNENRARAWLESSDAHKFCMDTATELRRLHQVDLAHQEWLDKTEWVQAAAQAREFGQHRADVIKQRFDRMTAQRDELLALLRIVRGKHGCGALTLPCADAERIDAAIAEITGEPK